MLVTTVRGKFDAVDGELDLDLDTRDPSTASGEIRLGVASLSTGSDPRDAHLRSPEFFDAEQHPEIVARITGIEPDGDDYKVRTEVTIRGITRPVTFDGRSLGVVPGLQGGRHAGFELTATIDREQWDLEWNMALEAGGWLVGKDVDLTIDVAADEVEVAVGAAESVAA